MRQIKTPKRFNSNAFTFSPKRKDVLLQMHLRLKQNVLAFSGPYLKALKCTENSCQFED